jgi:hypothetical protein
MKKMLSYFLGVSVGLLAVAPPINYNVPMTINSHGWLYGLVATALFGMFLTMTNLPLAIKAIVVYVFLGCFVSMVPYISFNAFILVVAAAYGLWGFIESDFEPVANMVIAAFLVQICITGFQMVGLDKLMNFDRPEPVFLGTVMQYMRFSSLLAIMAPILVWKNKWFIIPLCVLAVLSKSSGFAAALIAGVATYFFLKNKKNICLITILGFSAMALFAVWDRGSWHTELTVGRFPRWVDITRSWYMNTMHNFTLPLSGPIDWKSITIGRGADTFMSLFPLFKHDPNPFAQAHNCHLQLVWEFGLVGYGILVAYVVNLIRRIHKHSLLTAGLVCMLVNMFFAFPTRMTQTMFLMVAFIGLCEQTARKIEGDPSCLLI